VPAAYFIRDITTLSITNPAILQQTSNTIGQNVSIVVDLGVFGARSRNLVKAG
jgi:hypothetical protein